MQWRVPQQLETLLQHFGRPGRDGQDAVVILIAEKSDFYEEQVRKRYTKWKRQENEAAKANKRT